VAAGSKNAISSGKTQLKVVEALPSEARFGANEASRRALGFFLIESEREKDQKRPLRL
jgi:hypothetical protein